MTMMNLTHLLKLQKKSEAKQVQYIRVFSFNCVFRSGMFSCVCEMDHVQHYYYASYIQSHSHSVTGTLAGLLHINFWFKTPSSSLLLFFTKGKRFQSVGIFIFIALFRLSAQTSKNVVETEGTKPIQFTTFSSLFLLHFWLNRFS